MLDDVRDNSHAISFPAVSISVSVWTLVSISMERQYAICHPLKSRGWQTLSHAYRIIAVVWFGSSLFMAPIAMLSRLVPVGNAGKYSLISYLELLVFTYMIK